MKLIRILLAVLLLMFAIPEVQISADEGENLEPLVGEAYAVFNHNTGVLTFSRTEAGEDIPESRSGLTVYSGFENSHYSQAINVPWYSIRKDIVSIQVEKTIRPSNMSYWFSGTSIKNTSTFNNFDVQNVLRISYIFSDCEELESLEGLSTWKTSRIQYFAGAFKNCKSLTNLHGLEMFNTESAVDFTGIFWGCSKLENVDELINWNNEKSTVYFMESAFRDCSSLKNVDGLAKWDVSKVQFFGWCFCNDQNLTDLEGLRNWNTHGMWYIYCAFQNIGAKKIDSLAYWDVVNASRMDGIFASCKNLESIDLSGWNTTKVKRGGIFRDCINLREIVIGEKYSFVGGNITVDSDLLYFPEPPVNDKYTGKWCNLKNLAEAYTPDELLAAYDGSEKMAGTWVWQEVKRDYVIAFDANGGSGDTAAIPTSNWDQAVHLPNSGFYRFDHQFIGWSESPDSSTGLLQPGDEVKYNAEANETVTLYAQWKKNDNKAIPEDGWYEFTLKGDEEAVFKDLPTESPYSVYEETPDGWVLVESSGDQGTVKPNEEAIAAFRNKASPDSVNVQLTASKLLDGKNPDGKVFQFELIENDVVIETVNSSSDGTILFKQNSYDQEGTHTYTIRETGLDPDLYSANSESFTVTVDVKKNESGKLEANVTYPEGGVVFHNTTIVHQGTLSVSKTVEGIEESEHDFTFRLNLTNADGSTYTESVQGAFGDTLQSLKDGDTFQLKAGRSVLFTIPDGVSYSVTEISIPDGYTVNQETFAGTIVAGQESEAAFTNTYRTRPVSVLLQAEKRLSGGDLSDDKYHFSFELVDSDGKIISTVTNTTDGSVLFDELTYETPGDYRYTIREVTGDLPEVEYDKTVRSVVVHVTDPGNGQLTADVEYENSTVPVFSNQIQPGSLSITKTVENGTDNIKDREFTFTLALKDAEGDSLSGSYEWISSTEDKAGTIKDGETLSLQAGETITISDLPAGSMYSFTETPADGFELTASENTSGTIQGNREAKVSFTNTYRIKDQPLELEVSKTLTGTDLTESQFTFQLKDEDGTVIQEAKNDASGKVIFTAIPVSADSIGQTLKYTVSEVDDGQDFITYDEKTLEISVQVKDDGKDIKSFEIMYPENTVFENTYQYSAFGKLDLRAKKILQDGVLKDGQFSFELLEKKDGKETLAQTVSNNASGDVIFDSISYTLEEVGTHTYILREKKDPKLDNVVYDQREYEITVVVKNNGDGTLQVTADKNAEDLVFTNLWQEPVELPSTGESGIAKATTAGLGILAVSALVIEERRRRKN